MKIEDFITPDVPEPESLTLDDLGSMNKDDEWVERQKAETDNPWVKKVLESRTKPVPGKGLDATLEEYVARRKAEGADMSQERYAHLEPESWAKTKQMIREGLKEERKLQQKKGKKGFDPKAALPDTFMNAEGVHVPLNPKAAAVLVGIGKLMRDSWDGTIQWFGNKEKELADNQRYMNSLYDDPELGAYAKGGAVVGALAEPLGFLLPFVKGKKLWHTAVSAGSIGAVFGATGYVDEASGQTRVGNTTLGALTGGILVPSVIGTGRAIGHLGEKIAKRSGNQIIDNVTLQARKFQASGASQQLAWRMAKRKLELTDEDIAMASLNAGRKPNVSYTRAQAQQNILDWEQREFAMSQAPKTGAGKFVEDIITPITTRLQRLSNPILHAVRKYDFDVQRIETKYFKRVNPFLNAIEKLGADDSATMGKALFTGDFKTVNEVLYRTGGKDLVAEFGQVRKALKDIYKQLGKVGYDLKELPNYYPRIPKNVEEISKLQHDLVSNTLRKARQKKGSELTDFDIAEAMNRMLSNNYSRTTATTSSSLKARKLKDVSDELLPHYQNPAVALRTYIRANIADIERRKVFMNYGYKKKPKMDGSDLEDSIGTLFAKGRNAGLSKADQVEITNLLKARFGPGEKQTAQGIQVGKNLMYFLTLGNPLSAATQFADVVFAAHKHGLLNTIRSMFGKKLAKKEILGLEDEIEEFVSTNKTKKLLDWSLKWGGFKRVDRLGKETLMTAAYRKYNKWAQTPKGVQKLRDQWGKYFEGDTEALIKDLKNMHLTDNVKLLLWHELSNVQPIALSEMPLRYLMHPNGRVLYMLRSFTVKQLDFMRREILNQARHGNHYKAARDMAKFGLLFVAANSSVDAMKDFMRGKEISMEDHIVDNMWTLVGMNKFTVDTAKRHGPSRAIVDFVAPPLSVFDDAFRAFDDPKRIYNLMPPYGKLLPHRLKKSPMEEYFDDLDASKEFKPFALEDFKK